MKIVHLVSILGCFLPLVWTASYKFNLPEDTQMKEQFQVDNKLFSKLDKNDKNCTFVFDQTIIVVCQNGWLAIDQVARFFKSQNEKVKDSDEFKLRKVPSNVRSNGKFSSFTDPSTEEFKVFKYTGPGDKDESTYTMNKYGSKKTFGIIDSVVTEDLMLLYVKPKGDFSKRAVQFHLNDYKLTNIANINQKADSGQLASVDMIQDMASREYHVYIFKLYPEQKVLQWIFAKFDKDKSTRTMKVKNTMSSVLRHYPNNCADKTRVSQKIVVVICTTSGDVLILKRNNMEVIVAHEGSVDLKKQKLVGQDIGIIEHNVDAFTIAKKRPDLLKANSDGTFGWTKYAKLMSIQQTFVYISTQTETPLFWEILTNDGIDRGDQYLSISYSNMQLAQSDRFVRFGAGGGDAAFDDPAYLISAQERFKKVDVYTSCYFLQHLEGEKCVDNDEETPVNFAIPGDTENVFYGCKDLELVCKGFEDKRQLTTKQEIYCVKLKFVCQSNALPPEFYLLICIILLGFLTYCMCCLYCIFKYKLKEHQRLREEQRAREEAQRAERERIQRIAMEKVFVNIKKGLKYTLYEDIWDKDNYETCAICVDDFKNADPDNEDQLITETPQCNHKFHKGCLLQWVRTKIDKLEKPDCPQCRSPFTPESLGMKDPLVSVDDEDVEEQEERTVNQSAMPLENARRSDVSQVVPVEQFNPLVLNVQPPRATQEQGDVELQRMEQELENIESPQANTAHVQQPVDFELQRMEQEVDDFLAEEENNNPQQQNN